MGHEASLYGRIIVGEGRGGAAFLHTLKLHARNRAVINRLPREDDWPWLSRGMFCVPHNRPVGVYRTQVISFGESLKDDPADRGCWDVWLEKFEALLRRLYWWSAVVFLRTDFEGQRVFRWDPTPQAMEFLRDDPPGPITDWVRTVRFIDPELC